MKNIKNTNCKLADTIIHFYFKCDALCTHRVTPNQELRARGLTCAYQKQMTYSQINPTKVGGFSTKRKGEENGR